MHRAKRTSAAAQLTLFIAPILCLALGLLLAVPAPAVGAAEPLIIYSGRGEKFTKPIVETFQRVTGIPVNYQIGRSGALLAKIREEGARTPADVFITIYAGVLEQARKAGLLMRYDSPSARQIPAQFRAKDYSWVAISARTRVVVYNPNLVDPQKEGLTSLLDLAHPKWKGKVATVTSANQSFIGGLTVMYSLLGPEKVERFLRGLKANSKGLVFPKHTPIVSAVAAGQVPLGYVNHYYYYRHKAKKPNAPIEILYLDQGQKGMGAAITIAGAAILKATDNPAAAKRFIDFLVSPLGQKIFAEVNLEYPVSPTVPTHRSVLKRSAIKLAPVHLSLAADAREKAIALIERVGLE